MDCPFEENLFLYIDGMLAGDELLEMELHLKECSVCAEQMAMLKKLEDDFQGDVILPEGFTRNVLGKIESRPSFREMLPAVGLATLFLVLFLLPGSASPLPILGDMLSKLLTALKGIHVSHLLTEMMRQNASFLGSYLSMMVITVFFFQVWGRKKLQPARSMGGR